MIVGLASKCLVTNHSIIFLTRSSGVNISSSSGSVIGDL